MPTSRCSTWSTRAGTTWLCFSTSATTATRCAAPSWSRRPRDQLLALEARVASGRLKDRDKTVAAAEKSLARSPVAKLFTYTAKPGRFVYDYDHQALDYEKTLAGHYVLTTSLDHSVPASEVLACYRSLQQVESRFRVLKDFLHLRPVFHWTESRVRGHIAICVFAAVIEALIGKALAQADVRDPDLDDQHLSAQKGR